MDISYRLKKIASKVKKGASIADIGTDHAYIPIYLVQNQIVTKAIAMDVKKGPLAIANSNIAKYDLENNIETRLSDGLSQLNEKEVNTIIIAGMGGHLVIRILEEANKQLFNNTKLILQPQSDIPEVRRRLHSMGFAIKKEEMLVDEGKYYTIIETRLGKDEEYSEVDYYIGKKLIQKEDKIMLDYLAKKKKTIEDIIIGLTINTTDSSNNRLKELCKELDLINEVIG